MQVRVTQPSHVTSPGQRRVPEDEKHVGLRAFRNETCMKIDTIICKHTSRLYDAFQVANDIIDGSCMHA